MTLKYFVSSRSYTIINQRGYKRIFPVFSRERNTLNPGVSQSIFIDPNDSGDATVKLVTVSFHEHTISYVHLK